MFTEEYWKSSLSCLKNVRYLAFLGMMIALKYILSLIRIPISDNLNIMFTFIPEAIEAMVVGPCAAMISGAIYDTLSGFLSGYGPYFPGYLVSKLIAALIYSFFYYRTRITVAKTAFAKALVNYGVNVGLGALWSSILYGKAFLYYASTSAVKNTILLPFEIIILYALMKALVPVLSRKGWIKDTTI